MSASAGRPTLVPHPRDRSLHRDGTPAAFRPRTAMERLTRLWRQWLVTRRPAPTGLWSVWSFDVFDTAITRLVLEPDHVHWLVGRQARADRLIALGPEAWRAARIAAERTARAAARGEEVTLRQIYDALESQLGGRVRLTAVVWIELEVERALARGIAATGARVARLRAEGRRVAFISDSYLDARTVAGLLDACGYAVAPGDVLVSSEQGASKARGDLYACFAHQRGIACGAVAHTGDNVRADVINARRAGVRGDRFALARPNAYETRLFEAAGRTDTASLVAGAARAARLSFEPGRTSIDAIARIGTGVAGPLLTGWLLWVLETAQRDGIGRLFFLARDGQVLARLARKLAAWGGYHIDCRYLLGSRQAFFLASLPSDPIAAIDEALAESDGKRGGEVLRELELAEGEVREVLARARVPEHARLTPDASARLREALLTSCARAGLASRLTERRAALRAYLRNERFFDTTPVAIVDLGWKGNLQRRLERACGRIPLRGYYYDLDRIPADLLGSVATYAGGAFRNAELLEAFCMADHSSVQGFSLPPGGEPTPIVRAWRDPEAVSWGVDTQQEAVLRFADNLLAGAARPLFSPAELLAALRPAGLAAFEAFVERPAWDEATVYGSVRHARGQRHDDAAEIAPRVSSGALWRAMVSRRYRVALQAWMPGVVARARKSWTGWLVGVLMRVRQRRRAAVRLRAHAARS